MNVSIKIFVVGNTKDAFLPIDDIRQKFFWDLPHSGDNIDTLNPWYSEITGLYYLWKHAKEDILGLEHYRRYFVGESGNLISSNEICQILSDHDIIVHESNSDPNAYWYTCRARKAPEIRQFIDMLKETDRPELHETFSDYLKKDRYIQNNMFICRRELVDRYCSWLFVRLDRYRGQNHLSHRIIAYTVEYLFGAWLEYNKLKLYKCRQWHRGQIR